MRAEKAQSVDYAARLEPPYKWTVTVVGDKGNKLAVKEGEGSWLTGFFEAQDLEIKYGLRTNGSSNKKH
jgi:hypothetical protein